MGKAKKTITVMRRIFSLIIAAAVFSGLLCIGAVLLFGYLDNPPVSQSAEGFVLKIEECETGIGITRKLSENQLIRSDVFFKFLMKIQKYENSIKTGTYRIEPGMKSSEILAMLVEGKEMLVKVQIPEGSLTSTVAAILEISGVVSKNDFLNSVKDPALLQSLEIPGTSATGYLFPDTYYFPLGASAKTVVETMVRTFRKKIADKLPSARFFSAAELHERVIMASIIEREYQRAEEAPIIAGVFYNRLKISMPLQSCATVVYIITEELGKKHPSRLFETDLQIKSPYNTYINPGLPPGPICNPGMVGISAAIAPEPSR